MQIQQILNDDLLLTLDSVQNKTLIYGEGIGVGMNIGDEVPLQKMTEMQTLSDAPFTSHLISTLSDVPKEYIPVVKVIINDAEEKLDETLNSEIYIRLLDYIYITSLRINHGTMPSNEATYHLNKFYPLEVELAENAIITIRKELFIQIPDNAVNDLTLIFVAAQSSPQKQRAAQITALIQRVFKLVDYYFGIEVEKNEQEIELFIKHLKAFAHRIFSGEMLPEKDVGFQDSIQKEFPTYYHCAEMIKRMVLDEFQCELTREEVVYLAIHIGRMLGEK